MNVLIRPLITEKSLIEASRGRYTFVVERRATKPIIRDAVRKQFDAEVSSVQTRNVKGEIRNRGRHKIQTSDFKKAVVTLKNGKKIDLFEIGEEGGK